MKSRQQKLIKQNQSITSQYINLFKKLIKWISLFVIIVIFYSMINLSNAGTKLFTPTNFNHFHRNKNLKDKLFPKIDHSLFSSSSSSSSMIVKPLKYVERSQTLQLLTEEKLQRLFNIAKHYMDHDKLMNCSDKKFFEKSIHNETYRKRSTRLKHVCSSYGFKDKLFNSWHLSTNRRLSSKHRHFYDNRKESKKNSTYKYCSIRTCPLLVNNDHHIVTCFVPKIASTTIKRLYLLLENHTTIDGEPNNQNRSQQSLEQIDNLSNFHFKLNDQLYRISPAFSIYSRESKYFKTIFVRHPFVRLVSAFKDKAERNESDEQYFYDRYWNPLLDRLYGKEREQKNQHVTFKEFVEELLLKNNTDPYQFDQHWIPIWTLCEPCSLKYDFIGKLETSNDFYNFKLYLNDKLTNFDVWENFNNQFISLNISSSSSSSKSSKTKATSVSLKKCQQQRLKYAETIRYLSQLSMKSIIELYKLYYLDFELFGYTVDELFETISI